MLDKAVYSAFESTLNSTIASYRIYSVASDKLCVLVLIEDKRLEVMVVIM